MPKKYEKWSFGTVGATAREEGLKILLVKLVKLVNEKMLC